MMRWSAWSISLVILIFAAGAVAAVVFFASSSPRSRPVADSPAASDCPVVFTHHVTDVNTIESILPPLFRNSRGLMPTALIDINGRAPVYLPANGTLVEASYHLEEGTTFYWLGFDVGCGVMVVLDHVNDVIPDIAAVLPDTPRPEGDSRTDPVAKPLTLPAGTLVGYTTGAVRGQNWNFSVFNESVRNLLWDGQEKLGRNPDYTAVCPFEYFEAGLKTEYTALFQFEHSGTTLVEHNLCEGL